MSLMIMTWKQEKVTRGLIVVVSLFLIYSIFLLYFPQQKTGTKNNKMPSFYSNCKQEIKPKLNIGKDICLFSVSFCSSISIFSCFNDFIFIKKKFNILFDS